jgi:phage-related baseplate assembly protein
MQLSLQNFSTLVENMAAAVQGAATSLIDLSVGSVLRAILEANASIALWLQWLIVQTLATTRLATSTGTDCDSFGADFGFTRLPAVAAVGNITLARFTPTASAFVPVGTTVLTANNASVFAVTADGTNPAFSALPAGFTIAAGVGSLTVAAAAVVPGAAGNVQAGAVSLISSAISGVDTVTNNAAFTGGADAESDAAFRARFGNYLASLSRATNVAIGAAVSSIQQGLSFTISENVNQAGAAQLGHFVITVDDGSGAPSASLLGSVQVAVDAVRPIGTSFAVQGPVVERANVSLTLSTSPGSSHAAAITAVAGAIETYIAALPVAATLNYTRLAQLAYGASSSVTNISGLLLNGGTNDLTPPLFGAVRVGVVAVS